MLEDEDVKRLRSEREQLQREHDWLKGTIGRTASLTFEELRKTRHHSSLELALTFATLVVLSVYTYYTFELRVAAQRQVAISQDQLSNSLLPLVILTLRGGELWVQNVGLGPALNSGDIKLQQGSRRLVIYHASALPPGAPGEPVGAFWEDEPNTKFTSSDDLYRILRSFPESRTEPGKGICIAYTDRRVKWYHTKQAVSFSKGTALTGMPSIILAYQGSAGPFDDLSQTCK